jgi:DNA-binding Lrp family transcriptional regulator
MPNLWFTLAVPQRMDIRRHVEKLSELAGARSVLFLPTIKQYKLNVSFDMFGNAASGKTASRREAKARATSRRGRTPGLTAKDKKLISLLQEGIDLVQKPFAKAAMRSHISQAGIVQRLQEFEKRGVMRRFSAILYHRNAGFRFNVMAVWAYPENRTIDRAGRIIGGYPEVSHCYRRPTYPTWDYSLYAMIHCTRKSFCDGVIRDISKRINCKRFQALYGGREFKKTRIRYFSDDFNGWEERFLKKRARRR